MFRRRRSPLTSIVFVVAVLLAAGGVAALARGLGISVPVGIPVGGPLAGPPTVEPTPAPTPTPVVLTWEQKAKEVAREFVEAWARHEYEAMYRSLSEPAKQRMPEERFVGRYQAITSGVVITSVAASIGGVQLAPDASEPASAIVDLTITLDSARVGKIEERKTMALVREGNQWRVDWHAGLIFNDLSDNNLVRVYPSDPVRGPILDRKGRVLAGPGKVVTVGVVPGNFKDPQKAVGALSAYLGLPAEAIRAKYAAAQPDWWVPLGDLPESRLADAEAKLGSIAGVEVRTKTSRAYPYGSSAAHVVGYIARPTAEDLEDLARQGYEEEDYVGRAGIEAWAERELAGQKGGRVFIVDQAGAEVRTIGERTAVDGKPVQLTIDIDVQQAAAKALGDKVGSIVALDPRDNSILALVSQPSFDPNAFVVGVSAEEWQKLSGDARHPFLNRASLSAYPTGSIFKVITMAAGLEKGGFAPQSQFECRGSWSGLPGVTMGDWKPEGHGNLSLSQGLVESCDIVFYEIGKKLDALDPALLPSFARQFGLGKATGVVGLSEAEGTVPDPAWKQSAAGEPWYAGDTINLAIGQGFLEATPLQMANAYAALANGGELRTPVLVRRVGGPEDGKEYKYEVRGKIPASPATLAAIREAMVAVAGSPKGTAYYAFRGFAVSTAAKTGSAENQNPEAHAWFAGYAPADAPEIVTVVMVEGGEAGGEVAAPLGRQVLEAYFAGR